MNKNTQKPKLPPSPIRRPLINITNMPRNPATPGNNIPRPQSTKSIKSRISIDEFCRPKLKQVHSRKNCRSDSIQSCMSMQVDKCKQNKNTTNQQTQQKQNKKTAQRYCKNHKNRQAMHIVQFQIFQYCCFQCSLLYAKQGYKIKSITHQTKQKNQKQISNSNSIKSLINQLPNNPINSSSRRQQTLKYIQTCTNISTKIYTWRKQQNTQIKDIYQKYGQIINNLRNKMQIQLNRIKQIYDTQICKTQQTRQQQLKIFKQVQIQMQKLGKIIDSGKIDVQKNYQDCIYLFSSTQYRNIMDQYWQQITQAQIYLSTNSITNLTKKYQPDIKMTIRTMQRSDNTLSQFTFSKEKKFQTPPFSKQLRGIKIVQSQQDSQRYSSSLKQSVVDAKINFSQFCA